MIDENREGATMALKRPPKTPPTKGASQKSQSWATAQPPTKSAGPVLRAGFTEVLVIGMLIRWISVTQRPMASGAKPVGARLSVTPMITTRKKQVRTISTRRAAPENP